MACVLCSSLHDEPDHFDQDWPDDDEGDQPAQSRSDGSGCGPIDYQTKRGIGEISRAETDDRRVRGRHPLATPEERRRTREQEAESGHDDGEPLQLAGAGSMQNKWELHRNRSQRRQQQHSPEHLLPSLRRRSLSTKLASVEPDGGVSEEILGSYHRMPPVALIPRHVEVQGVPR